MAPYSSRDKRYITGPIGIQARPRVIVFDHLSAMHEILLSQAQVNEYSHHYRLDPLSQISQLAELQLRILFLALGLVHDPRLVLLDEPLAGLPAIDHPVIWQYMRQMQSEGRTLLTTFTPPLADEHLSAYDVIIELTQGPIVRKADRKGIAAHAG